MGSGASKPDSSNPILTVNTAMNEYDFIEMGAANHNNQGGVQIKDSSDIINSKKEIMEWLKENYTVDNNFFPENIKDEDFVNKINELWRNDKQDGGGARKKRKRKTRRKKNKNSTRKRNRKKIKSKKKKRGRKKSRKKR